MPTRTQLVVFALAGLLAVAGCERPPATTADDEGDGVTLVWAPAGPGWNWKQPWGGYPSWQDLALYGVPPIGLDDKPGYGRQGEGYVTTVFAGAREMAQTQLCRYLSADGTTLLGADDDDQ